MNRLPAISIGRFLNCRNPNLKSPNIEVISNFALNAACVSPHELIEKLAALVPPPRIHLIRYHGVLAANANDRALIVPSPTVTGAAEEETTGQVPLSRSQRLTWAVLLARVFEVDALVCPRCGGRMKLVAALTDPDSIRDYLTGVGLPADPPAMTPARPPPQQDMEFLT